MKPKAKTYEKALELKDAGRFAEAIAELRSILARGDGRADVTNWLLAALHLYELENPEDALPFAKAATVANPNLERASVCLVHCLFDLDDKQAVDEEIRRFVATGSELREYKLLFEENGVTAADFA